MSFVSDSLSQVVQRVLLVVLRVYLGTVVLVAGWGKLSGEGEFASRLVGMAERNIANGSTHGFYQGFLEGVVVPNAGLFAALVIMGEVLGGLALITGTATRLAAGGTAFMMLNFMFLKGRWFWMGSSNDAAFFFIALIVMLGAAGRAFGVDYYLAKRWPAVKLW
ncbi:MAG: DoxX family protein [Gemmatimonadota bacterium]|nr:MAG: DoxX family protein [Gemmatimonadota bacterium]